MVRATIVISAVFALAASVSAVPRGSLIDVNSGHHLGVNNVNLQGAGQHLVDGRGIEVKDAVQRVDVGGHEHHHGLCKYIYIVVRIIVFLMCVCISGGFVET